MFNQIEYTYDKPDGTVIATENPDVRAAYDLLVDRAIPNSAYATQWNDDWTASQANGEFATMLCPGWMHGIISGNAPDVDRLEDRRRVPERRRQLGRFVPHHSGERRERRGRARAR